MVKFGVLLKFKKSEAIFRTLNFELSVMAFAKIWVHDSWAT